MTWDLRCIITRNLSLTFLNACNFNKDAFHTQCTNQQVLFAANTMSHKSYMEGYLHQFNRNVKTTVNFQAEEKNIDTEKLQFAFKDALSSLTLKTSSYALSDIKNLMNQRLQLNNIGTQFLLNVSSFTYLDTWQTVYIFYICITPLASFQLPSRLFSWLISSE